MKKNNNTVVRLMTETRLKHYLIAFLALVFSMNLSANNVVVDNITYDEANRRLEFDVSCDNVFGDSPISIVWKSTIHLVFKYKNSSEHTYRSLNIDGHGRVSGTGSITREGFLQYVMAGPSDDVLDVRGYVTVDPVVSLMNPSFKVIGIELIQVPTDGDIYFGDGSSDAFHVGDSPGTPVLLNSSITARVPNQLSSGIWSTNGATRLGRELLPERIMRYEITQEQYVDFLNSLSRTQQNARTQTDISGTSIMNRYVMSNTTTRQHGNGIRCDGTVLAGGPITFYCDYDGDGIGNEFNDGLNVSANYLSPNDLMAYLDWVHLSPMSQYDYEFACRGKGLPEEGEFAWGTSNQNMTNIYMFNQTATEVPAITGLGLHHSTSLPRRTGSTATATTSREQAGASYWGIMDLTGNVGEMVTRCHTGDYEPSNQGGDGTIGVDGNHNEDWNFDPNSTERLTTFKVLGLAISSSPYPVSYNTSSSISNLDTRAYTFGGRGCIKFVF